MCRLSVPPLLVYTDSNMSCRDLALERSNMPKHVLVISTSLRPQSQSELLADHFIAGVQDAGHDVKKISLKDRTVNFCEGAHHCFENGECIKDDDMGEIRDRMAEADILAFATPVYFSEMCGQFATLLDRTKPLLGRPYAFRDVYLLAASAGTEETVDGTVRAVQNWLRSFPFAKLAGSMYAAGLAGDEPELSSPALKRAYEMGWRL